MNRATSIALADGCLPHSRRRHAFWRPYGLDLPGEMPRELSCESAPRVVAALDRSRVPH